MKSVSADLLSLIPDPKAVHARATFRLARPKFTTSAVAGSVADPSVVDTTAAGIYVYQVANVGNKLYYRCIADVDGVWPDWTDSGVAIVANSKPGCDNLYSWYQRASDGAVMHAQFNTITHLLNPGATTGHVIAAASTLAPISLSHCAALTYDSVNKVTTLSIVDGSGIQTWSGRIYGTSSTQLDAVSVTDPLTGADKMYLYFMDRDAGRILELSCFYGTTTVWGTPRAIVPIDAIDDVYGLKLHHASVVNNMVVVTGRLTRTSDGDPVSVDVYLMGPEAFTMGRDLFISDQYVGGKLVTVGTKLVSAGCTKKAEASGAALFGLDDASLKTVVSDIGNLRLTEAENRSSFLTLELDPSLSHIALAPGAEVTFEFAYDDQWMTAFTGEVDSVRRSKEEGEALLVGIISKSMKRLGQWAPEQGVYVPSQAWAVGYADDLSLMIRGQGKFTVTTHTLTPADNNKWDVLYTAARSTKNGLMRARFYNMSAEDRTAYNPRFGVGLNYYRETAAMAAARLGVDPDTIEENQLGHNGLVAIYSRTEYDSTHSGLALYSWVNSVMTQLTKVSIDLPHAPTNIWLQISLKDGLVRVDYRADTDADWTNILTYTLPAQYSWMSDEGGAGCVLMMRELLKSAGCAPMTAEDDVLAVFTNTPFASTDAYVLVEDELIYYGNKSTYNYPVYDGAAYNGAQVLVQQAFRPGDNAFAGGSKWPLGVSGFPSHVDQYYRTAAAVLYAGSSGEVYPKPNIKACRVTGYDPSAATPWYYLWWPTSGIFLPGWMASINDTTKGAWTQNPVQPVHCLYLDRDITQYIPTNIDGGGGFGQRYSVYLFPALYNCVRGNPVPHGDQMWSPLDGGTPLTIYQYYTVSLNVTNVEFYTSDEDVQLTDALRRMLVQAGGNASSKYELSTTRTVPAATWDVTNITSHERADFIAEIDVPADPGDGFGVGLVFRSSVAVASPPASGYFLRVGKSGSNVVVTLTKDGLTAMQNVVVGAFPLVGTLKFSVHGNVFSVWLNHLFLMSFSDTTYATGNYKAFVGYNPSTVTGKVFTYRLSELDDLLADITVGVRGKGPNVLQELLGDRPVYFRTETDGSLFFYRNGTDVGRLPDIVTGLQKEDTDARVTRVRAEGVNVVEVADFEALSDVGNIFETINSQYGNNVPEITLDANAYLNRLKQHAASRTLSTVIHPALQPGDKGVFTLPEGDVTLQVLSTDFMLGFQGDSFVCDMQIQVC